METVMIVLAVANALSAICNCAVMAFRVWLDYKKSKEPKKDEIWETAVRIFCSSTGTDRFNVYDVDDFSALYSKLRFIHDHPQQDGQVHDITELMDSNGTATDKATQ